MKLFTEIERNIHVKNEVDVLVCGSGPAGIGAALAAARNGAKTMLIEQLGVPGGISTAGLMSHWTGDCESAIYREIIKKSGGTVTIDPEKLKMLYFDLLYEAGVVFQSYTFASNAIVTNHKIDGVITESKAGREAILSKVVIDASGDGDVASRAGAAYSVGRETDGKMQPVTLMFKVGGVAYDRAVFLASFEDTFETEKGELQALARKHLTSPAGHVLLYRSTLPGVVTCNMTNCTGIDGTKPQDLTRAEYQCRRQIIEIIAFLKEFVPGYKNCYLLSSASLMGVRESRHFKGVYTLTENDILNQTIFPDWVVKDAWFNFDVHNITGAGLDDTGVQKHFPSIKGYTIPYGCLVPEKIDGLLFAGRNISGTHMAHSSYRAMPICVGIGEAAGIAAAESVKQNIEVRNLNAADIQKNLMSE